MDKAKIEEVFSDKEFVASLIQLETPQEVQAALAAKEIDVSVEEICRLREALAKMVESGKTELSDEELEQIAGGGLFVAMWLGSVAVAAVGILINDAVRRGW